MSAHRELPAWCQPRFCKQRASAVIGFTINQQRRLIVPPMPVVRIIHLSPPYHGEGGDPVTSVPLQVRSRLPCPHKNFMEAFYRAGHVLAMHEGLKGPLNVVPFAPREIQSLLSSAPSSGGLQAVGRWTCSPPRSHVRTSIPTWPSPDRTSCPHSGTSRDGISNMRCRALIQSCSSHGNLEKRLARRFTEVGHERAVPHRGGSSFCSTRSTSMFGRSVTARK